MIENDDYSLTQMYFFFFKFFPFITYFCFILSKDPQYFVCAKLQFQNSIITILHIKFGF